MTYQVLARKWRPQDFPAVVGQQPIVTALSNALAESRVAQAYLFSGIRGVGKTSVARIFAKALNCENGPTAEPCGVCSSCTEIEAGTSLLDVIEVDAATYSKVEQVRELTESLKYGPARDRYKVVILDEIHRLSRQAFDALLKIVEEPPDHLVFIFATTEIESVPATILSRCQEFRFRRVSFDELTVHLEKIAQAEQIEVGSSALRLIARASDGSVRDAVALLDQLATFGSGTIEDETAAGLLGGVDTKLFRDLLAAVLGGRSQEVGTIIGEVERQGWDPRYVYTEFLHYCRSALHLALGADGEALDLPREESASLASLVGGSGHERLLRLLHLLLSSEETVRRSESGILALEVAWLRAAELPRLVRIEKLLSGQPTEDESPAKPPAPADREPPPAGNPPPPATVETFLGHISRRSQALAAHLAGAQSLRFENGELTIATAVGDTWIRDRLARKKHLETFTAALAATWGDQARWRLVEEDVAERPATDDKPEEADDPRVQTLLDIFGGSVESAENDDQA